MFPHCQRYGIYKEEGGRRLKKFVRRNRNRDSSGRLAREDQGAAMA